MAPVRIIKVVLFLSALFIGGQEIHGQTAVLLDYFNLSPDGSDVVLEWQMKTEDQVLEYRVFRKFNNEPLQAHIATITPNGTGSYQYLDDDIFKSESEVITYELQVVMGNNQIHEFQATLSFNPTSVQRTWGSIKSMFR